MIGNIVLVLDKKINRCFLLMKLEYNCPKICLVLPFIFVFNQLKKKSIYVKYTRDSKYASIQVKEKNYSS